MTAMRNLLGSTFFWLAAFLAVLEPLAARLLPYSDHPRAADAFRNPTDHRAWPEYLRAGERRPGERLVVLLSASQGIGKEVADPSRIYPAHLRRALARSHPEVRFENWASGGLRTVDLELLTMAAVHREAELAVLALTFRNFDEPQKLNLDFPFTDIDLLAGDPRNWGMIRDSTFAGSVRAEDLLRRTALRFSSLARMRTALLDAVVGRAPPAWHRWLVGRPDRPRQRLDGAADPAGSIFWTDQTAALAAWQAIEDRRKAALLRFGMGVSPAEIEVRLATFRDFHERLTRRFERAGVRQVWVFVPHSTPALRGPSLDNVRRFYAEACRTVRAAGQRCHTLLEAMPQERFVDPGHFDEAGHALFAERMLEVVGDELQ